MRIMHLLKHGVRGNGSVHVAVDLACAQAKAGHQVTFVSGPGSFSTVLERSGVRVVEIVEAKSISTALLALLQTDRAVRASRSSVIHAHMMSSAIIGRIVATARARALVTTVHNSFDGHSWLMRLGDLVIAVSDAERRALVQRGFSTRRIRTVLNGVIGTMRDVAGQDHLSLVQPAAVTLCGLHPRKGVDDVIRAFAGSDASRTWHLNVVGWGPQRVELEQLAQDLGAGDRIHFHGPTEHASQVLQQAQLFITGSLADPCPLAVMEARAASCAIIGTRVGGIPEILAQGEAGRLVPPRDPVAMTSAIDDVLRSVEVTDEWRRRAFEGSEFYNAARMAREHNAVYAEAIHGSFGMRLRHLLRSTVRPST